MAHKLSHRTTTHTGQSLMWIDAEEDRLDEDARKPDALPDQGDDGQETDGGSGARPQFGKKKAGKFVSGLGTGFNFAEQPPRHRVDHARQESDNWWLPTNPGAEGYAPKTVPDKTDTPKASASPGRTEKTTGKEPTDQSKQANHGGSEVQRSVFEEKEEPKQRGRARSDKARRHPHNQGNWSMDTNYEQLNGKIVNLDIQSKESTNQHSENQLEEDLPPRSKTGATDGSDAEAGSGADAEESQTSRQDGAAFGGQAETLPYRFNQEKPEEMERLRRAAARHNYAVARQRSAERKQKQLSDDRPGRFAPPVAKPVSMMTASYVFSSRPDTPPRKFKQDNYRNQLTNQMDEDAKNKKQKEEEKRMKERLDRQRHEERLASERHEEKLRKHKEQQDYYNRLRMQLSNTP